MHLFAKIEDGAIEAQIERLRATQRINLMKAVSKKQKLMTQFDIQKLDLKIGTIAEAEKMPKADKLMLKVGMGEGAQRTIVLVAEHYTRKKLW